MMLFFLLFPPPNTHAHLFEMEESTALNNFFKEKKYNFEGRGDFLH